jgi:hypothetical protein
MSSGCVHPCNASRRFVLIILQIILTCVVPINGKIGLQVVRFIPEYCLRVQSSDSAASF